MRDDGCGKKKKTTRRGKVDPLVFVLIIMLLASVAVILLQNRSLSDRARVTSKDIAVKMSAEEIRDKVGRHVELPDEYPLLATVENVENLSIREFFKDAINGDRVLIFPREGYIVIYRADDDKVVYAGLMN